MGGTIENDFNSNLTKQAQEVFFLENHIHWSILIYTLVML